MVYMVYENWKFTKIRTRPTCLVGLFNLEVHKISLKVCWKTSYPTRTHKSRESNFKKVVNINQAQSLNSRHRFWKIINAITFRKYFRKTYQKWFTIDVQGKIVNKLISNDHNLKTKLNKGFSLIIVRLQWEDLL